MKNLYLLLLSTLIISFSSVTVHSQVTADYTYSNSGSCQDPHYVLFFDASIGAASHYWDFGDGNTAWSDNPIHEYAEEGEYLVTLTVWSADTMFQDQATKIVEVFSQDWEAPEFLEAPSDIVVDNLLGTCGALVYWDEPIIMDDCSEAWVNSDYESGDEFSIGEHTVWMTAEDSWGNMSEHVFTVTVEDIESPTLSVIENETHGTDPETCSSIVIGIAPLAVSDNCTVLNVSYVIEGATEGEGMLDASGTVFNMGNSTVTYTVTDGAGNTVSSSFVIMVEDFEDPWISCSSDITEIAEPGADVAEVSVSDPDFGDNCGIDWLENNINGTEDASGIYPLGTTTVEWFVADNSGNIVTCTQNVTVEEPVVIEQDPVDPTPGVRPTKPHKPAPNDYTKNLAAKAQAFILYPNPATELIQISFGANDLAKSIAVFDLTGRIVSEINSALTTVSLDVSEFQSGMYLVKVEDTYGIISSKKFFVK